MEDTVDHPLDHLRNQSEKPLEINEMALWRQPRQPHPGTQCHRYGCSLPGLTGLTVNRCGGTDRATITTLALQRAAPLYRLVDNLQPLCGD